MAKIIGITFAVIGSVFATEEHTRQHGWGLSKECKAAKKVEEDAHDAYRKLDSLIHHHALARYNNAKKARVKACEGEEEGCCAIM